MNFMCQRPYAFYGLIVLVPAVIIAVLQYKKIISQIKILSVKNFDSTGMKKTAQLPFRIIIRTVFRCLAWMMLVFAYAGFSWGTYLEPVQKNGTAVSFVFDISYSMNADDAPGDMTRLEAAGKYAEMMLSYMENPSVSVVLAKGDGVAVVPLTEDRASVEALISSLSPELMTSVGTSIGKGIETALKSFPPNSAQANTIWVFTDGDETDGQLENALSECLRCGVSVSLIGFGSEREIQVLAGDGKTPVMTALRSEKMRRAVTAAVNRNPVNGFSGVGIQYIDATEPGSALKLLEPLKKNSADTVFDSDEMSSVSYEVKPENRYGLFLSLAFIFLALSFIASEFTPENISEKFRKPLFSVLILAVTFMFTSCGGRVDGAKNILKSSWAWYQRKYYEAVAGYLQTSADAEETGDKMLHQYAVYDLAAAYLMMNEDDAALERLKQITPDAPKSVRYAAYYNAGIIAHRKGDYKTATQCFRDALKADGTKTDAKINLELSLIRMEKEASAKESSLVPASENNENINAMQKAVFERIRENDQKQWKNSGKSENSNSSIDY